MNPAALNNMDDANASVTASNSNTVGGESDTVELRFTDFCKSGLALDDNTYTQAMKLFKETKHLLHSNVSAIGNGTVEEAERFWFTFVLFSVKKLSEKNGDKKQDRSDNNGFNLCQVLKFAKLNIADFFKELHQFAIKAGPVLRNFYGADWESRLEAKELQANFVHLSVLSKK